MKRNLFTLLFFIAAVGAVQAQTSRTLSLNGRWRAAVSETQPDTYPSTVPVPGVMSQAEPAPDIDFDATQLKDDVGYDYVWYATEFDLSNPHDGYDNGNYTHALLRIRAKYNALVILNGVEIGYDAHCTYSHAEFDVTRALDFNGPNRLVVRVGSWNTASFPSKDNSSEWWRNSRAPGICDDVTLCLTHDVTVRHLKLLPDVAGGAVVCTARVANFGGEFRKMQARVTINDCRYDLENGFDEIPVVCEARLGSLPIPADSVAEFTFRIPTPMLKPWTPGREGDPQLYQFNFILADDRSADCRTETFGFRDIRVEGRDVLVNGRKTLFRAENIAFQRALNRWADVMFDEAWIRRFLRAAVEDYGFNYLRIHLGHAYNKWYDIADELGLMIQDEWRFMHDDEPAGEDLVQTETEFRRWVEQNVNHPSIVVWDQENEGNVKLEALKTELRQYDPTRLWGEDDFEARHIYEYSETIVDTPVHPVSGARPSTVLESCRLWLNERGDLEPRESFKTSRTASGWGFYFYTLPEIERLQADIHADLGTFYRSRRVQAWAPFALLSGAVNGHSYFLGNLADSLTPQPNLRVLARLNEPVGTSVEMNQAREWYKEKTLYRPGGSYAKTVWVWNDTDRPQRLRLEVAVADASGRELSVREAGVEVAAGGAEAVTMNFVMPRREGVCLLKPRLVTSEGRCIEGVERRLMVARKPGPQTGVQGFGGHGEPFEGCRSVLENFIGQKLRPEVQAKIVHALGGELIDRAELRRKGGFLVRTTRYLGPGHMLVTTRTFDEGGTELAAEQSEALTYVKLPEPIRRTIARVVGMVPVDESKIVRRRQQDTDIYTVTTVGRDVRYTIRMTPSGTLIGSEMSGK